jgi:hypothetical protein
MHFISELVRFLDEQLHSAHVAHAIMHMSQHAFQHFLREHAPSLWALVKDNIGEVFDFVQEWVAALFN